MGKKINTIGGGLIILFCMIWILKGFYTDYQFHHHFKIITGQVTGITSVLRQSGNRSVEYEYFVNKKKISSANVITPCSHVTDNHLRQTLMNKTFPVAYDVENVGYSAIILTAKDAQRFDYKIPDSLSVDDSGIVCN